MTLKQMIVPCAISYESNVNPLCEIKLIGEGQFPKGISAIALSQTQPDQTHCSLLENQMRRQSVWRVQDKPHICCVRKLFQNFQLSSLLLSTQRSPMLTNPTPKRPVRDACTHKIDDFSEKPQGEGESQFLSIENMIFRKGLKKRPVFIVFDYEGGERGWRKCKKTTKLFL